MGSKTTSSASSSTAAKPEARSLVLVYRCGWKTTVHFFLLKINEQKVYPLKGCSANYPHVEKKRRISNIKTIPLVSSENVFKIRRGAVEALYLGQSRDARLHNISKFIIGNQYWKFWKSGSAQHNCYLPWNAQQLGLCAAGPQDYSWIGKGWKYYNHLW